MKYGRVMGLNKSPLAGDFSFPAYCNIVDNPMSHEVKTIKEICALTLRVWREAAVLFMSIEVWLLMLVAVSLVAGLFLAFMGEASSLLAFGFSLGYLVARPVLHAKGILKWPFL